MDKPDRSHATVIRNLYPKLLDHEPGNGEVTISSYGFCNAFSLQVHGLIGLDENGASRCLRAASNRPARSGCEPPRVWRIERRIPTIIASAGIEATRLRIARPSTSDQRTYSPVPPAFASPPRHDRITLPLPPARHEFMSKRITRSDSHIGLARAWILAVQTPLEQPADGRLEHLRMIGACGTNQHLVILDEAAGSSGASPGSNRAFGADASRVSSSSDGASVRQPVDDHRVHPAIPRAAVPGEWVRRRFPIP